MKNIITFIILSLLVNSSYCKRKNGKKKEAYKSDVNICDEVNRMNQITCFCIPVDGAATEATCWVYGTKITGDDPVWNNFEPQSNLETLKFNIRPDGTMPDVPTAALRYLKHLKYLEIEYANILELTPYVFANLSSLSEITLSSNQIAHLHGNSFSHMENLTIVNLDMNRITEIKRGVFYDVPNLKKLFLNKNNLSIVHDYAFEHLGQLEELEINWNQISIITRETFFGLKSLILLDLKKNRLTMLGDYTFAELPNLHELDVEQNLIEYISDKAFAGLKRLRKLRLSENNLRTLSSDVFKESPNIFILDLRSNWLESLTYDTLKPIWENLKNMTAYIKLEKNKLKCDCNLLWVHTLKNETNSNVIRNSLEELICMTDETEPENESQKAVTAATEKSSEDVQLYTADVQYDGEDVEYDESAEADYEYDVVKLPRKHFFNIPIEKLPCPQMLQDVTEMADKSNLVHMLEGSNSSNKLMDVSYFLISVCALTYVLYS